MNIENALRLRNAIERLLNNAPIESENVATARVAMDLIENELLSLGWKNSPSDVPAMDAANEWVNDQVAKIS